MLQQIKKFLNEILVCYLVNTSVCYIIQVFLSNTKSDFLYYYHDKHTIDKRRIGDLSRIRQQFKKEIWTEKTVISWSHSMFAQSFFICLFNLMQTLERVWSNLKVLIKTLARGSGSHQLSNSPKLSCVCIIQAI